MGISMSDKFRFAEIERLVVDTIKDLPDGWDYITHMSLLKAEHEVAEDLRDEIEILKDTIDTLEADLEVAEASIFAAYAELADLNGRLD